MFSLLYVDDEPGLLEIGKIYLENTGDFSVTTAVSGRAGLEELGKHDFDAIVADYQMPEMDGIELLKNVRKSFGNIPYILFTGRGREEVVIDAINNGADFYLQKGGDPIVQFAELSHKIRQAVGRRRVETALSDSEKRLADIIDFLPDATFAIDNDGKVIAWNRAIEKMTGIRSEEILGKGDYEYALPFYRERRPLLINLILSDDPAIADRYPRIKREGTTLISEITTRHFRGDRKATFWFTASPLYNRNGELTGAIESIRDITERKQAEEELKAANEQLVASEEELKAQYDELAASEKRVRMSEARLTYMLGFYEYARKSEKDLLAHAVEGAGIVTGSPLGYLAFLNEDESELSMYAWSKAAIAGCSMREKPIVYKTEKTGLWGEAVRQRRPVITNDYAAPNKAKKGYPDGHPHILRHMNIPVIDEGRIVLVAGVANKPSDYTEDDVSELLLLMQGLWTILKRRRLQEEQKAAYEQLAAAGEELKAQYEELAKSEIRIRESMAQFRELAALLNDTFTGIKDGISILDKSMTVIRVNPTMEAWYSHELPLTGRKCWEVYHGRSARCDICPSYRTLQTGQPAHDTVPLMDAGKQTGWLELYSFPLINSATGELTGVIEYVRNITAEKQAQDELKNAYEQISATSEELRQQYEELSVTQEKLQQHQQQLEEIAGTVPGVIYQFYARRDGQMGLYFVSNRAQEVFGISSTLDDFFERFTNHVDPRDREIFLRSILDIVRDGLPWHYEGRFIKPSGEEIWFEGISRPVRRGTEMVYNGILSDITERKRAQEKLLESETNYRLLFETAAEGILIAQGDRMVRVNRAMVNLLGYPEEVITSQPFTDFIHPDDRDLVMSRHLQRMRGDVPLTGYVFRIITRDGEVKWVLINSTRMVWSGQPASLSFLTDITDQKVAEDRLVAANEEYTNLLNQIQDIYYRADTEGRLVKASRSFATLLGYDDISECLGRNIAEDFYLNPDDRKQFLEEIGRNGKLTDYEIYLRKKDGGPVLISTSSHVNTDAAGRVIGIEGTFRDITERKRVEKAILESERKYRTLYENAEEGIWTVDGEFRTTSANRKMQEIFGYTELEMVGRFVWDFVPPDEAESMRQELLERPKGISGRYERRWARKDGTIVWCFTSGTPLFSPDGTFIGSFGMFTDITERKRAEDALRESEAKFRAVIDQSFEFIGLMSTDGTLIVANRSALEFAGISESDVINRPFWETPWWTHSGELRERLKDAVQRAAAGETVRFEATHPAADGHIATIDFSLKPVVDTAGRILYLIPEGRDITNRKRAEDALRESEGKFRQLITSAPLAMGLTNSKGEIEFINNRFMDLFGYTHADIPTLKDWFEQAYPDDEYRKQALETWDAAVRKGLSNHADIEPIEYQVTCKNGSVRNVIISGIAIEGKLLATFMDMTERTKAEDALRESEEKYRTLVESSFDGIAIHQDGIVVYANRTAAWILGADDPAVFVGKPALDLVAPAFRELIAERMRQSPQKALDLIREQFVRLDGTLIDVDVTTSPTTWQGRPAAYVTFRDITAQVRAEEALRESEEKYRMLVEQSRDGVFIIQDSRLVFYNKALVGLTGYTTEELDGRLLSDLIAPEDREMVISRARDRAMGKEVPELYDLSLLHKDGINRTRVRVRTGLGTYRGRPASIGMFFDVTEDRRREAALRESEEKFRELTELLPQIVFEMDTDMMITFVNRQTYTALGYMPDEVKAGIHALSCIDPSQHELIRTNIKKMLRKESFEHPEYTFIRKDGSTFPALIYADPVFRDGELAGFRGIIIDISDRKRAENALRESEQKYRMLVEINRDIIYTLSTDGIILYVSPQTIPQLGYRPDEMEGRTFSDFVHPDDLLDLIDHIKEHFNSGKPARSDQFRLRRRDGTYRWYMDKTIYTTDNQGRHIIAGTIRDITEEKAAQDGLRESEEKFRALVETTSDFIWEVNAAGVYTYVSPHVRQILGYEPEELLGKTPFDIMPAGEAERVASEFRHCAASRLPIVAMENRAVGKDGSVVILETSGVVRTGKDGSYSGYRGIDRDITKRKRAEGALRESEARLSSILHGSPVLQFVIDRNHRIISWNRALEEYSGIRAADIVGTDQQWRAFYPQKRPVLADLLIDGDREGIERLYAGKLMKPRYVEEAYEATDFFPHMGMAGIWLSFTAAPVRDETGTIIGAVETLEDVTERINAENALRESEERVRTILNTAQAGIVLVDANTHRIIDSNRKALELIGLDRELVIGAVCHRFICPAEEGNCPVTDCGQQVDTSERILIKASGEEIPVLKTVVRISMGGRDVLVESFVDISERKRSEEAIREANRKLNLLNSITRHDIRNQLMVAQGYTQLASSSKPDPVILDFLKKITMAIQTIQRQIEFTKEYQELGVHAPAWFLLSSVIGMVRPEKISVRNTCSAVEIFADPMIDKVFYNLFDNAMKYGEHVTTITVGCRETDRGLVIMFADNGIGIPAGEKEKIFDKGYGRGTGFGLFLAREILAITGITIGETGTEGTGAVFELTVPKGVYRRVS